MFLLPFSADSYNITGYTFGAGSFNLTVFTYINNQVKGSMSETRSVVAQNALNYRVMTDSSGEVTVLGGTPVTIGTARFRWRLWLLIGLAVVVVVAVVILLLVRRRKSKKSGVAVAELIKETESKNMPIGKSPGSKTSDPGNRLQQLKLMLDKGLITQQDYDDQKKKILEEHTK